MTTAVSAIVATFVTFPLLPWLLICFVLLRWQPKQKAIRHASDWTLPFFLLAVVFICHELWPGHGAWLAIIFIAVFNSVAAFVYALDPSDWNAKKENDCGLAQFISHRWPFVSFFARGGIFRPCRVCLKAQSNLFGCACCFCYDGTR